MIVLAACDLKQFGEKGSGVMKVKECKKIP